MTPPPPARERAPWGRTGVRAAPLNSNVSLPHGGSQLTNSGSRMMPFLREIHVLGPVSVTWTASEAWLQLASRGRG